MVEHGITLTFAALQIRGLSTCPTWEMTERQVRDLPLEWS